MLDDIKLSSLSIDRVTQFGLRPPELLALFNNLGTYYRWFLVDGKIAVEDFDSEIQEDLFESSWIDCLQRKIKFRKNRVKLFLKFYINIVTSVFLQSTNSPID